jgi:hypothetical protein
MAARPEVQTEVGNIVFFWALADNPAVQPLAVGDEITHERLGLCILRYRYDFIECL